ncbi:2-oxoacid:acceptor oxidoreductase family protein [Geoalkalibacter sp.]|uniref:2-oxoacid:acceptor oxidoreductase family protein n=1 Tax=Geoalkalibacter sp. TaxID=3041440 RepID=UPI00272ED883|nr:2-oxoacid:acceptor oxidoreductase family protein [Geoalkalibacter sp.]
MTLDLFIAGFGGQGVLLLGNLLAYAAILEGKNASYFPAYGVEKRGGAATCTVVISDDEVASPVVGRPGCAILLNQASLDKYLPRVRPGGWALVNSSLAEENLPRVAPIEVLALPLTELALDVGDARLVNLVAAGIWARKSQALTLASLESALRKVLPERNHRFIPLNVEALKRGAALIAS